MRWDRPITGETRVRRWFALFPVKAGDEVRWLEFVTVHQSYNTSSFGWCNDWFVE